MEHCIQINLGEKIYKFNIDVKEADLTASLSKIFNDFIIKNKDNKEILEKLKEDLKTDPPSNNTNLLKTLSKDVLSDEEVSDILNNYLGNTSIYNISAYFNTAQISKKFTSLVDILGSRLLNNGSRLNTSDYDIILLDGVKNKVLFNNDRTVLVINPNSKAQEINNLFSIVYTINQLKEPNSKLFKEFKKVLNSNPDFKDNYTIDKLIYSFLNPNLETSLRNQLNEIISKDINNKIKISDKIKKSEQESLLFDLMFEDKNVTINNESFSVKDIINFKNKIYSTYYNTEVKITEDDFKKEMELEEIDSKLYPKYLWDILVEYKPLVRALYTKLSNTSEKLSIKERLNQLCYSVISENMKYEEPELDFNPDIKDSIFVEEGTSFSQNRVISLQHDNDGIEDYAIVVKNDNLPYKLNKKSLSVPLNFILNANNKDQIKKYIAQIEKNLSESKKGFSKIYRIKFDSSIPISSIKEILKNYSDIISRVVVEDGTLNDVNIVKESDNIGLQVDLYSKKDWDSIKNKYSKLMPIKIKALTTKYIPLRVQSDLFTRLQNESMLIPVNINDKEINNYLIGESFNLYNGKDLNEKASVTITDKIPLYFTYYNKLNNNILEIGDLVTYNNKRYVYLQSVSENEVKCLDLSNTEITTINPNVLIHLTKDGNKITVPVNEDNSVWCKLDSGKEIIYNSELKTISKLEFFNNQLDDLSEELGFDIEGLLKDNKKYNLIRLKPTKYKEATQIINNKKYYSIKDLVEQLNKKLNTNIPIVWFNNNSKEYDINANAMTKNGVIYFNESKGNLSSYIHELSHIILAALKIKDPKGYNILISNIKEVPNNFKEKYKDLTLNDLKEEYLVFLFSNNFTNLDESIITDPLKDLNWDLLIKDLFGVGENTDVWQLMNSTIASMLDTFGKDTSIFKENKFQKITKLAALKQALIKNGNLTEECN